MLYVDYDITLSCDDFCLIFFLLKVMIRTALEGALFSSVVIAAGMWTKMLPFNTRWAMTTIGVTAVAGVLFRYKSVSGDVVTAPAPAA